MRYSPVQYASALRSLVEEASVAERREVIREFLDTLARQNALPLLPDIIRKLEEGALAQEGRHAVTIRAPERLSEVAVARKLPFKSQVKAVRDARLQGGAILEVDGLRADNSIKMRLTRAREALTGN